VYLYVLLVMKKIQTRVKMENILKIENKKLKILKEANKCEQKAKQ